MANEPQHDLQEASATLEPAMRAVLDGLYYGALLMDDSGAIACANGRACSLLHYGDNDLSKLQVGDVFSGFDQSVLRRVKKHLEMGRSTVLQASCICRDGSNFRAEVAAGIVVDRRLAAQPLIDREGVFVEFVRVRGELDHTAQARTFTIRLQCKL